MSAHSVRQRDSLAQKVKKATGTSPSACYQCGRCSAGCPQNLKNEMDLSPTKVLRLLQLEDALGADGGRYLERLLGADTPWLCAGCQACTTRCPQGVDIAGTMDVLRQEALKRGQASKSKRAKDAQALHKSFLNAALSNGHVHELSMMIEYKLRTQHFLEDAMLGAAMFFKGKLHLKPPRGPGTDRVRNAIAKLKQQNNGGGK
jgi:heterodisulfide reductase subunit C